MVVLKTEGLTKEYRTGFWRTRVQDLAVKAQVGFLPENPYFYDYLTGREFLHFYGQLFGIPYRDRRQRIEELLQAVGLSKAAELQLRKYSKGMLQRIGLAQALINDPQVIVLDEPTSGLDPVGRKEVRDLILDLKARGKTVFFSTHIVPDAEMICDRVGIIVAGRLTRVGTLEELLGREVERIEITASGFDEAVGSQITQWSVRPPVRHGDKVLFAVNTEKEASQVMEFLLGRGASGHAVHPKRRTLEDLFLQEVAKT